MYDNYDYYYCDNIDYGDIGLTSTMFAASQQHQHYLTIEELKSSRVSCWLCGCNWQQDHVSLDCPECGGYALTRPCPDCDGKCKQTWTRNLTATHDRHRALWTGQCNIKQQHNTLSNNVNALTHQSNCTGDFTTTTTTTNSTANNKSTIKHHPSRRHNNKATSTSPTSRLINSNLLRDDRSTGMLIAPPPSSCCSSTPSSATVSDEDEPDDMLTFRAN